jgi:hypothetical protein
MSDKDGGADPLVAAIGEFRQELVGWIDSLLGAMRERHARTAVRPPEQVATVPGLARRSDVRRDAVTASQGRTVPREENQTVASDPPLKGDSRHRLDALARQLGDRLRHSDASRGGTERADGDGPSKDRSAPAG